MRNLMWAGLAAGCLLAGGGSSFAQDTVRLGGQIDIQGDTDLMRGGGGGGGGHGGGGGRGGGGHGGYGGYGHGGYGGGYGRGGYGGGYGRGGYGYGGYGYGGYGRGYGYGGYGYGLGGYGLGGYGLGGGYYPYPVYYPYYTPYYTPYYSNFYNYPIVGQDAPTMNLQANYYSQPPAYNQPFQGTLPLPGGNGTYPYNGGPNQPIPMPAPGANVNPANERGIIPLDGKLVSFPSQTTGGFSPVGLPPVQPRTISTITTTPRTISTITTTPRTATTTTPKTAPVPRVVYPAYGESPR